MGEDTENPSVKPPVVIEPNLDKADDLARIVIAYADKILQLTANQKMITPLIQIKLHSIIVDCVAEIINMLEVG